MGKAKISDGIESTLQILRFKAEDLIYESYELEVE